MRCLIVEDDPFLCQVHADVLCGMGFTCDMAMDLETALGFVRDQIYKVMIVDYHLGAQSAAPILAQLEKDQRETRVILVTGTNPFPATAHEEMPDRIAFVLQKPARLEDLETVVEHLTSWAP